MSDVRVNFSTILASIRMAKALLLLPRHQRCLMLWAAESEHDSQHKLCVKPKSFVDLSPLTQLCCTMNQMIMKKTSIGTCQWRT